MSQDHHERDSDEPISESVELLPFAQSDNAVYTKRRGQAGESWSLRQYISRGAHNRLTRGRDQHVNRLSRSIKIVAAAFLRLASYSLHLLLGSSTRRNVVQTGCRILFTTVLLALTLIGLLAFGTAFLNPSYTHFPPHYVAVRQVIDSSQDPGRANPQDQRIFIAASLYDPQGLLLGGAWAESVSQLIQMLGPQNTYLSIYESDSGPEGEAALRTFSERIHSPKTLLSHDHVPTEGAPIVRLPNGRQAVKRIEYLARARNLALEPLKTQGHFDKILYLNDVFFDPVEAVQLIFLTNSKAHDPASLERSNYRAACALDFANPFKYYDTLATRDFEGFSIGVPIYPFFTNSGKGESRRDVRHQLDSVRVKACWGGMVAFDARFFQQRLSDQSPLKNPTNEPGGHAEVIPQYEDVVRFRSEPELDYEYSECCLIHADLASAPSIGSTQFASNHSATSQHTDEDDLGIYMNPYIRTAYEQKIFENLWVGRRLEKMLVYVQGAINYYVNLPFFNGRRTLSAGDVTSKIMWVENKRTVSILHKRRSTLPNRQSERSSQSLAISAPKFDTRNFAGHWEFQEVAVLPGGYCAIHHLLVRRIDPQPGDPTWDTIWMPLDNEMRELNGLEVSGAP